MATAKNTKKAASKNTAKSASETAAKVASEATRVEVTKPANEKPIAECPYAEKLVESGATLAGPFKGGIQPIERIAEAETTVGTIQIVVKLYAAEWDGSIIEYKDRKDAIAAMRENRRRARAARGGGKDRRLHRQLERIVDKLSTLQGADEIDGDAEYSAEWIAAKTALNAIMGQIEARVPSVIQDKGPSK